MTEAMKWMLWIKQFLQNLDLKQNEYVTAVIKVHQTNQECSVHSETKHIGMRDIGYDWLLKKIHIEKKIIQLICLQESVWILIESQIVLSVLSGLKGDY